MELIRNTWPAVWWVRGLGLGSTKTAMDSLCKNKNISVYNNRNVVKAVKICESVTRLQLQARILPTSNRLNATYLVCQRRNKQAPSNKVLSHGLHNHYKTHQDKHNGYNSRTLWEDTVWVWWRLSYRSRCSDKEAASQPNWQKKTTTTPWHPNC